MRLNTERMVFLRLLVRRSSRDEGHTARDVASSRRWLAGTPARLNFAIPHIGRLTFGPSPVKVLCPLYKEVLCCRTTLSKCIYNMLPETEILVHISAPCGATDDARYRKESQGYLLFKSANRHPLCRLDSSAGDAAHVASSPAPNVASNINEDKETDHGNIGLSTLRTPCPIPQKLPKIHVTRTPLDFRPQTAPASISCIKETPVPLLQRRSQTDSRAQTSSFIPDSQPSLSWAIPVPKRRHCSISPSPIPLSSSPSSKRRRITSSRVSLGPQAQPSSPLPDRQVDWKTSASSRSLRSIIDPPPQPSNAPFKTYITAPLALIIAHLPLDTFYISFQAQPPYRHLKIHERGHWSFSISSISIEHKRKVWTYLEKFIGEGRAGRVSCFLEEERNDVAEDTSKGPATAQSNENSKTHDRALPCEVKSGVGKQEFLRVYCMGEAVPSIWLLLFIATNRQIKGRRAQWIDASGKVVVQMK